MALLVIGFVAWIDIPCRSFFLGRVSNRLVKPAGTRLLAVDVVQT